MKISFIESNCPKTGGSDYHSLTPVGYNVELRIGVGILGARLLTRLSMPGSAVYQERKQKLHKVRYIPTIIVLVIPTQN
jgi:hypothetical protein